MGLLSSSTAFAQQVYHVCESAMAARSALNGFPLPNSGASRRAMSMVMCSVQMFS
jgi:hypothetical protein